MALIGFSNEESVSNISTTSNRPLSPGLRRRKSAWLKLRFGNPQSL
ncbi:MAG: hypothetical protein JMDDDDMK_00955 [Acidobacteria bacterium]|nr:hypothetical protein [Acidobacteriota bacterium]